MLTTVDFIKALEYAIKREFIIDEPQVKKRKTKVRDSDSVSNVSTESSVTMVSTQSLSVTGGQSTAIPSDVVPTGPIHNFNAHNQGAATNEGNVTMDVDCPSRAL